MHSDNQKAPALLVGGDGDADAHIGVLRLLLVGGVALGIQIIAPPVSQGGNHGAGGGILGLAHIRLLNKAVCNQVFDLVQLGVPRGFAQGEEQGHGTGGHGGGEIRENGDEFFHEVPSFAERGLP